MPPLTVTVPVFPFVMVRAAGLIESVWDIEPTDMEILTESERLSVTVMIVDPSETPATVTVLPFTETAATEVIPEAA